MSNLLSLKDTQRGELSLGTALAPLVEYLRHPAHWVPVGFRPLRTEAASEGSWRVRLPEVGAMGFKLTPELLLQFVEDDERHFRLVSVPQSVPGYEIDFLGLFHLAPRDKSVDTLWEAQFTLQASLPGFLAMLPRQAVQSAAQVAVGAMTASVCRTLVDNISRDYRQRHGC